MTNKGPLGRLATTDASIEKDHRKKDDSATMAVNNSIERHWPVLWGHEIFA